MTKLSIAKRYLKKWKKLLRLDDWKIDILIKGGESFNKLAQTEGEPPMSLSETNSLEAFTSAASVYDKQDLPYIEARTTQIVIRNREDLTNEEIERCVIHELLHIMLSYVVLYKTPLEMTKVEQVVRTIEDLLFKKQGDK